MMEEFKDRFGRAYAIGATIVYPTRRGSFMELVTATVMSTGTRTGFGRRSQVVRAKRTNGSVVTLKNLWDAVVVPAVGTI